MDKILVQQYAAAVQARPLVQRLPDGLREHVLRFEQLLSRSNVKYKILTTKASISADWLG